MDLLHKDDCVSINWTINNFSRIWQRFGEACISPDFFIYMPEETKWNLLLFPQGSLDHGLIAFFLYRDKNCNGAEMIDVNYKLEILVPDGSILGTVTRNNEFRKDMRHGSERFLYLSEVIARGLEFQDIVTLRCRMTLFEGKKVELQQIYAQTTIRVERRYFLWPIEKFSNLVPDQKQSFVIQFQSKETMMQVNIFVREENDCEEKIYLTIRSFDQSMTFSAVKISIIDSKKQNAETHQYECWFDSEEPTTIQLMRTKKQLMDNRSLYLPNDTLTLSFELIISAGFAFEGIEKVVCLYNSQLSPNVVTDNWRKCIASEKVSKSSCALVNDITSLYNDQTTCDMKLQAKTNVFPVHTLILGARSPVFKAMFSNEMKEKICGCVDVSELDDTTIRQFLLYLYTDQLEDLSWDDALQLYKTADKYAVISLRDKCSTLLKSNLNLKNACEALVLSDLHQDKDLKIIIQNFILLNGGIIFNSEEWKLLADANSKVVFETMLLKWKEKTNYNY